MSAASKGKAFEKKVEAFLVGRGFTVMRTWPKYGFFKKNGKMVVITSRQDFFGCADLVAIHPGRNKTYFIQCTLTDAAVRRTKMEAIAWNLDAQNVTVWKRMEADKQAVKIYRFLGSLNEWSEGIYHFRNNNTDVLNLNEF